MWLEGGEVGLRGRGDDDGSLLVLLVSVALALVCVQRMRADRRRACGDRVRSDRSPRGAVCILIFEQDERTQKLRARFLWNMAKVLVLASLPTSHGKPGPYISTLFTRRKGLHPWLHHRHLPE